MDVDASPLAPSSGQRRNIPGATASVALKKRLKRCQPIMSFRATAILLLFSLAFAACGPSTPVQQATKEKREEGLFELQGLRARIHDDEGLQTLIRADRAYLDLDKKVATLESVSVEHYTSGTIAAEMRSDEGILYLADNPEAGAFKNDFVLRGRDGSPVWISKGDTITVFAQAVRHNSRNTEAAFVTEDGPVEQHFKTSTGDVVLKGARLEIDATLLVMRMIGKGELLIGDGNSTDSAVSE
jgi:hypothetical protein